MKGRRKVAVLGLDGVPFDLLEKLFADRVMPQLSKTAAAGAFLRMRTVLPAISSVAWSSFMTGANPGQHGIFGFTDLNDGEIELRLPSFDDIRAPVLWLDPPQPLSVVVNVPFTYPARPLNGALISGFVAPKLERSVYPVSMLPWLKSKGYRVDVDAVKGRGDRRGLINDLFETLNLHIAVILDLMENRPWDLFIAVITGTDRLHHFFYDAIDDPGHPFHEDFMAYYRLIDSFIIRFQERLSPSTRLILVSDHGFAALKTQVYVNQILKRMGYINFRERGGSSLERIDPRSSAFALDPNRIYLNSSDRFRGGRLSAMEKTSALARLKRDLETVRVGDFADSTSIPDDEAEQPLFAEVLLKEDVYHGDCLNFAPDLILLSRQGYDLKASMDGNSVYANDIFTGCHTHDNAFLMVNDPAVGQRLPGPPRITDVAGLIREALR